MSRLYRARAWMNRQLARFHAAWARAAGWTAPVVAGACLFVLFYETDQMIALMRALAMALDKPEAMTATGHACDLPTLFGWWLSCFLVLWGLVLVAPRACGARKLLQRELPGLGLNVFAIGLILAPLFLDPRLHTAVPWAVIELLCLYLYLRTASNAVADPRVGRALLVAPSLIMLFAIYDYAKAAPVLLAIEPVALLLTPDRNRPTIKAWLHVAGRYALLFVILMSTLVFSDLLNMHKRDTVTTFCLAALLTLWWQLPAIGTLCMQRFARTLGGARGARCLFILSAVLILAAAWAPAHLYLPCTVNAFAAFALAFTRLTSGPGPSFWRRFAALWALAAAGVGLYGLGPDLDFSRVGETAAPVPPAQPSRFHAFYQDWLSARGEQPGRHGPLILVAAAGGGLRAAAHTALSLAAFDDVTDGRFGKRVFALSGVSGGALGLTTWLGIHTDGIEQRLASDSPYDPGYGERRAMGEYYRGDFATPVINRMLAHDLPLAAIPFVHDTSDRDVVLREAWERQWRQLLDRLDEHPPHPLFERAVEDIGRDPRLPLIIMNTTSAQDGMRAVYSSVRADFSGARQLDARMSFSKAVMDSARFALVTPIRPSCSDTPPPSFREKGGERSCPGALPVADGGYIDNSGLASLDNIIDELKHEGDDLSHVFVIVISSDGSANLNWKEGKRFRNGYPVAELMAPGFVLDAARSAHTSAYKLLIQHKLPAESIDEWDLSTYYRSMADTMANIPHPGMGWPSTAAWARASYMERRIDLPPLGWTIDSLTLSNMTVSSNSHAGPDKMTDCAAYIPKLARMCRELNGDVAAAR